MALRSIVSFRAIGSRPLNGATKQSTVRVFVLSLALQGFYAFAAPQPSAAQQTADAANLKAQQIAAISVQWMTGKLSTPGFTVETHELARSTKSGRLSVQYNMHAVGAPKNQTLILTSWPINAADAAVLNTGLVVSANGLVLGADGTPIVLTFSPMPGEVSRLNLVSADKKAISSFSVVPKPMIHENHGCSVEAVRLMPHFELAVIRAKGFRPNEDLQFASKSYSEAKDSQVKADANGEYLVALLPFVKNKKKGTTTVKLKGANCAPEISFEWGGNGETTRHHR
jgi:hypothetical protein